MRNVAAVVFALGLVVVSPSVRADAVAVPSANMPDWESQVLGGIFGVYCGYYPDRMTLTWKSVRGGDYAACAKLFAQYGPACVTEIKAQVSPWQVATSQDGTALGTRIGTCIDQKFDAWLKARDAKKPAKK